MIDILKMGSKRNLSRQRKRKSWYKKIVDRSAHENTGSVNETVQESASVHKIKHNTDNYPRYDDTELCRDGFIMFSVPILCEFIEKMGNAQIAYIGM